MSTGRPAVVHVRPLVHIERSDRTAPGGETWVELPGELIFIVSADGVTHGGAMSLQACWRHFIAAGKWRYKEAGGCRVRVVFHRLCLPDGVGARVRSVGGLVDCWLSPEHFCAATVSGLQTAARASIASGGWRIDP